MLDFLTLVIFHPNNSREFEQIADAFHNMDCVTAHIEIGLGVGPSRRDGMNQETIFNAVTDIRNNRGCISSAKLTMTDDQKSNVFDLLHNIENDSITYTIQERGELGFPFMSDKMAEKYDNGGARARVLNALRRGE